MDQEQKWEKWEWLLLLLFQKCILSPWHKPGSAAQAQRTEWPDTAQLRVLRRWENAHKYVWLHDNTHCHIFSSSVIFKENDFSPGLDSIYSWLEMIKFQCLSECFWNTVWHSPEFLVWKVGLEGRHKKCVCNKMQKQLLLRAHALRITGLGQPRQS